MDDDELTDRALSEAYDEVRDDHPELTRDEVADLMRDRLGLEAPDPDEPTDRVTELLMLVEPDD